MKIHEFLSTEEVWAYLLRKPNPWGEENRSLYKLYANASGGECPIQIDTSTPSCGNSRFGCWTCTVVERDKASEGLLASGDELFLIQQFWKAARQPDDGGGGRIVTRQICLYPRATWQQHSDTGQWFATSAAQTTAPRC